MIDVHYSSSKQHIYPKVIWFKQSNASYTVDAIPIITTGKPIICALHVQLKF